MSNQFAENIRIFKNNTAHPDKVIVNIARLIALCLVSGFSAYFLLRSQTIQEISFIALIVPTFLLILYRRTDIRAAHRSFIFSLFYLIPALLSFFINYVTSNNSITDIIIMINLFYGFYIASIFANTEPYDLLPHIMKYIFILSLPLFIYVAVSQRHAYAWGRWEPFELQPNWWGMMVLGAAWGSTTFNNIYFRLTAFSLAFIFMVELQSRGSLVALLPILLFGYGLFLPLTTKKVLRIYLAIIIILIGGIISEFVLEKGIFTYTIEYIFYDVFLIDDPRRGLGSGMTGRADGYLIAWKDFLESPALGNGFGEYGFVHNGFLLTLAETGLLGLTGMILILGRCLIRTLKQRHWIHLGLFLSYIAALMTFPRSFNINMTGFLFIILIMKNHHLFRE
jgi:O-antigen ligase